MPIDNVTSSAKKLPSKNELTIINITTPIGNAVAPKKEGVQITPKVKKINQTMMFQPNLTKKSPPNQDLAAVQISEPKFLLINQN